MNPDAHIDERASDEQIPNVQILDTLADGRQLRRYQHALATEIKPGQLISDGENDWPIFRHDAGTAALDLIMPATAVVQAEQWQLRGTALKLPDEFQRLIFVTHDDGVFAALHALHHYAPAQRRRCIVLSAFQGALPFRPAPSRFFCPHLPARVIAAIPLLEDWQVLSRLAHGDDLPGCYDGAIADLLNAVQQEGDQIIFLPAR